MRLFTRGHNTHAAKILVACRRLEPIIHAAIRIDSSENGLYRYLGNRRPINATKRMAGVVTISALGILPRLSLALIPWLTGNFFDSWFHGCFASESPFCIYYWYPPGMDVMFALLVLAPFMTARTMVTLRVLALVILSVLVHALSVEFLVGTRGSLDLPGVDSIFVNIIPIAVIASIITVSSTAIACGLELTRRLFVYSLLAGIPVASIFLLFELVPAASWLPEWDNGYWAVWHLSICCAIYYGRQDTQRREP